MSDGASTANSPSIFRFTPPNDTINALLDRNKAWATLQLPALLAANGEGQYPQIMWLGCCDSRAPETTILDLLPGEVLVHRNVANLLPPGDPCSLSVVQYGVGYLKVKLAIVCGHYCCGGVDAVLKGWPGTEATHPGIVDSWLKNLRDVRDANKEELLCIADLKARAKRLVELNVVAQVGNLRKDKIVKEAIVSGKLQILGVVYDVRKGRLIKI